MAVIISINYYTICISLNLIRKCFAIESTMLSLTLSPAHEDDEHNLEVYSSRLSPLASFLSLKNFQYWNIGHFSKHVQRLN